MNVKRCLLMFALAVVCSSGLLADDDKPPKIAATVGEVPINVDQVARELKRSTKGRKIADAARPALEAAALDKLVDRELALKYLSRGEHAATKLQIDQLWDRLSKLLESREIPVDKYMSENGIRDMEHWRHEAAWQLSWRSFRAKLLSDENLAKFYDRNRRHYDGSQVRVAHILFKSSDDNLPATREKANELRKKIVAGELSFADAAKKHSESPTAAKGGDIGLIDRRKTMPESFSKVAFDLKVGDISEPTTTKFGVHLIRCLEVQQGQQPWQASREQLTEDVTRWLFMWAADQGRKDGEVKYTGASPYWKRGPSDKRELVQPQ